jgi:hypothetical protein
MAWHLFDRGRVAWHDGGVPDACSFAGLDLQHARAIGLLALGDPTNALDTAAMVALTGR